MLLVARCLFRVIASVFAEQCAFCCTQIVQKVADLQDAISEGATSFLVTEYKYMGVFMVGALPSAVWGVT